MNESTLTSSWWSLLVLVILPILIIAAAELDERLRQRESPYRRAVLILRNWALPFFAIWSLLGPVLGVEDDNFAVRVAGSGLVLSIGVAAASALSVFISRFRDRPATDGRRPVPQLVLALPKIVLILVTGWILIDRVWGVDLSAALTALGVTSLVVSFALQDTLSGLASGLLLLGDQPFKPGDWIRAGDVEGVVVDINWRTSRIRDRDGDVIVVPNSQLAGASVTNFSAPNPVHRVVVSIQVAYKNPPTLAKAMLLDAATSTPGVLTDPPPNVRVVQIDDPLMGYEVDMWIEDFAIEPRVKSDFGSLVWYHSHRHEVPLPSPAQDLYLYDGVANDASATPTPGELRSMLENSPMLTSLDDTDLDRLAHSSRSVRFAVNEHLMTSRDPLSQLMVIVQGRALLMLEEDEGPATHIGEVNAGDFVGLLETSPVKGRELIVRAQTDCDVVTIDSDAASEVASRNPELSEALNRSAAIRRRRIERLVEYRSQLAAAAEVEVDTVAAAVETDSDDPDAVATESRVEEAGTTDSGAGDTDPDAGSDAARRPEADDD